MSFGALIPVLQLLGLHFWRGNALLSMLTATLCYKLIQHWI